MTTLEQSHLTASDFRLESNSACRVPVLWAEANEWLRFSLVARRCRTCPIAHPLIRMAMMRH
ncbi:hypothetical protein BQ8794_30201 [Mesorhizobium prunaredense]|uniref:Uncharacterized protein n=1 Tax=Mesorhizobium prunaredense TaxID=1631249 RepID=A0A1R3VD65_9HYPH|nr:hypothetical protein BQ8794_30201 [Mesorhizobium prunaredense]